jgi:hypothetical protein
MMATDLYKDRLYSYKGRLFSMEEIQKYFAPEDRPKAYAGYVGPNVLLGTPMTDFERKHGRPPKVGSDWLPSPPKKDGPPRLTGSLLSGGIAAWAMCGIAFLFGFPHYAAGFGGIGTMIALFAFLDYNAKLRAWEERRYNEISAKLDQIRRKGDGH